VLAGENADDLTVVSYTVGTDSAAPKDVAGNAMSSTDLPAASSNIGGLKDLVIDTTAPTLVISDSLASGKATGDVTYTFEFSEPVTGFDADDVTVTNGTTGAFTEVSGSNGKKYTVLVTPGVNTEGTDIGVSVGTGLTDVAGNAIAAPTTAEPQAWDRKAPTITGFTSSKTDGAYKANEAIVIQATASEALQAGAQVTVTLNTSPSTTVTLTRHATTANLLEGTYTVSAGQNVADLSVTSYTLGTLGAAPKDTAGNLMISSSLPTGSNLGDLKNLEIDTLAPTTPTANIVRATDDSAPNLWTVAATQATRIASATGQSTNNRITVTSNLTGDMTAEGWFKVDNTSSSTTQMLLYIIGPSGNSFELFVRNGNLITWSTGGSDATIGSFSSTDWNHFAVTTNGSGNWTVFQNGVSVHTRTGMQMAGTEATVTVHVGNHNAGGNSLNGLVSSVELWDTQRTAEQNHAGHADRLQHRCQPQGRMAAGQQCDQRGVGWCGRHVGVGHVRGCHLPLV